MTYAGVTRFEESPRYTFYERNIGDNFVKQILEMHLPDYIINFAAETHVDRSIDDPFEFVKTNVISTYNFITYVQDYYNRLNRKVRFLHMSTDEVYGHLRLGDPAFTEETPYAPNSPYSATKASSDHLIRAFNRTFGLPAIIANCSNNYGPRQFPEKFIPVVIMNALNDRVIPVYGHGMHVRDWLYVEDHCEALYLILTKGNVGEKYNIGGNGQRTNLYVVNTVLAMLNKPKDLVVHVEDRKGHDFRYAVDYSKLKAELGWEPKHVFEEGLSKTINWYIQNMDWVRQCGHSV
jgi:dTDP-glucose 4,6-dehydratase